MLRNLTTSLILYEKIDTTLEKAKETKTVFEKIISGAKVNNLSSYKKISSYLFDNKAAQKVRDELIVRYKDRNSGFVRLFNLPNRLGDNAKMARLELIDRKVFVSAEKKEETNSGENKLEKKETKTVLKSQRRLDKLSATQNKDSIITSVRTKASRKTGSS